MSRVDSRDAVRCGRTAAYDLALQAQLSVSSDRHQAHHGAINYLPFIDGLRAIAILAVVTYLWRVNLGETAALSKWGAAAD